MIDWWIITRDTFIFLLYLVVLAVFLYGNNINQTKALILVVIYIVHILLMKFSSKYEIIIKHNLANTIEVSGLKKIA